ncbi:MAG: hypothetical protein ABIQ06_04970 [Caldimonas sp.]
MPADPATAAKTIKSAAAKIAQFKDYPPAVKADWDAYKTAVAAYALAVEKMGGASTKDRTDYDAKKKEVDALKKKIDDANQGGKAAYNAAMAAKLKYQAANNKIADKLRNDNDPKAKATMQALRASMEVERAGSGLASPGA